MAKKTNVIEAEILKYANLKPQGAKEDRQDYLHRLVRDGNDGISKEDWKTELSPETKKWIDKGIDDYDGDIDDFEDGGGKAKDKTKTDDRPRRREEETEDNGKESDAGRNEPAADEPVDSDKSVLADLFADLAEVFGKYADQLKE